jgi:hypothetical protein
MNGINCSVVRRLDEPTPSREFQEIISSTPMIEKQIAPNQNTFKVSHPNRDLKMVWLRVEY